MSNWRHKPENERDLFKLMARQDDIVKWVKARREREEGEGYRGFIIGVGILKGGTGKSTTVLYLALYMAWVLGLKVAVVDTDDNSQSLSRWVATHKALIKEALGKREKVREIPFTLIPHPARGADAMSLKKRMRLLDGEYDVIIIDLGGGDTETFIEVCAQARLLLMPSAPSGWETDRIQATLQTAANAAVLNREGLDVYNFFVKGDFATTLCDEEREAMAVDLSEEDEDFVMPPFLHPYFDISKAPHHARSWSEMPRRHHLEEWGLLIRHAMLGIIEEDAA